MNRVILLIGIIAAGLIFGLPFYVQHKGAIFEKNVDITSSPLVVSENIKQEDIRQPAVAGQFYPADPDVLSKTVDDYLNQAEVKEYPGIPQIIISPHAGYIYSGKVAAYSFKQIEGADFKRVILIGRSHKRLFPAVAADGRKIWATPLGQVFIDQDFINTLKEKTSAVTIDSSVHDGEHSLEIMLPFLIKILGSDIKIVPLLFGDEDQKLVSNFSKALSEMIDKQTLIVVSTDLSHYPVYEKANFVDKRTIDAILNSKNIPDFYERMNKIEELKINNLSTLACAKPAVAVSVALAEKLNLQPHFLKYANSGDYVSKTKNRVVGYAAIVFNNLNFNELKENALDEFGRALNFQEQKIALRIARKSLEAAFRGEDYKPETNGYEIFKTKRGAFVTLKKHGQLRGCIGFFEPDQTLDEIIKLAALSAAFRDIRFLPLAGEELKEVEIEISILSPSKKINNPDIIEVGKHGVYIQRGGKSGVYLPQVPVEQGWDKETYLNSLCEHKVGLEKDCWRNNSTDIYIFTAQVFGEEILN